MKRWLPGLLSLALAALVAMPIGVAAQGKDTLTVALTSLAETIDPHMHFQRVGILVNINMFDSLLHRSAKLEFEPSLALSWKALNDTTWEFKLREGVKFHNGDTMTAEDVKFSFGRAKGKLLHEKVREVEVVSPTRVRFHLHEPWPDFMTFYGTFASGAAWVVPKKYVEQVGPDGFKKHPIGLGPYKFVSNQPGIELVLEAYEGYWRKMPSVKRLVFQSV